MSGVNRVFVMGNLGQDPELRFTQGGQAVATISVATNEVWQDKDGQKQEHTEWHRVVVWGKAAENVGKYLKKGSGIHVEGKLRTRSWEDKDGTKKYTTEIIASQINFVGSGNGGGDRPPHPADAAPPTSGAGSQQGQQRTGGQQRGSQPPQTPPPQEYAGDLNDIPF